MANAELNAKREQALKMTRGATRKISRLKNTVGVEVSGTQFDPRKPPKLVGRYTSKQLDAYMARVAQFTNRGTQFVPDAHKRPIPAGEMKGYDKAWAEHNRQAQAELDPLKNVKLPGRPETVAQRRAQMIENRSRMAGNPSVNDPYAPRHRTSREFANREAVKKLTRDEKRKSQPGWDQKELKRQIGEFSQMTDFTGDTDLANAVKQLTPAQFKALWNATDFATAVSTQYELARLAVAGKDKPSHQKLQEDAFADARRLVQWARKLQL
jgi:hypothetical protein